MGLEYGGYDYGTGNRWSGVALAQPRRDGSGYRPMLHGLNLGLVAVWIQDERRKRSYQLDRAEELALMMAEGSLDVTPEERTAIILLDELDRLGE